tara:strand:- start:35 stop:814 length:780 start_codon:yes stop_codon:yes gene_type:complete
MNCYNGEKFLDESLKSVIRQTYKNWELIFWDNQSQDNSKKIMKKFKNKRFRYFKSTKFQSLYAARNSAIKKAKGKFISFLDTDDWWRKDKIKKQIVLYYKKNQKPDLIYSNCFLFNQKTKKKKLFVKNKLPEGKITQNLLDNYCVGLPTILVKKDLFLNHTFNNKYNIIGDFDFVIRLSREVEFACIQEPLANYRHHEKNYSQKNLKMYIQEINYWFKNNRSNLEKKGFSLKKQVFLLRKLQVKHYLHKIKNLKSVLGV